MLLTTFLALGVFDADVPTGDRGIVTPASRTLTLVRDAPRLSVVAAEGMDPSSVLDYNFALSQLLEPEETFRNVVFAIPPESAILSFRIMVAEPHMAHWVDPELMRLWLGVDADAQGSGAWAGQGTLCGIEFTATTNKDRRVQATAGVRVAQK